MYKEYRYGYPHCGCNQCIIDVTAENNSVARKVTTWCLNNEHSYDTVVLNTLWDMNIIGVQIEWALCGVCKNNNSIFIDNVLNRDKKFIESINNIAKQYNFNQKVVVAGAFYSDVQGGLSLENLQFPEFNRKTIIL